MGQQLGGYTILQRIGRGGMGDVFLAQHRRVARRAAVKVLIPELSQKATVLDRFFNEARATSLIKHPGIVEILDCDVLDGQAFIIMEFLDGESLGAYLHRTGPLPADMPFFLGMATAVAGAVGAAHATGIIHRDLKPDNVYLHLSGVADPAVTVKVLDFGIAKLIQQDAGPSQTSTGMLLGTPAYMSPEQCRGAGRVDARSDIYSLGCIFYESLLGWPPFVREGMGDLIIAHVSETPEAPAVRVQGLAPEVNALVMRMLAKNADDRPQTMDAVAAELAACARKMGIAVERILLPRAPVERPGPSAETGPTQAQSAATPAPAAPSGRGTMPLRPAIGSGPIAVGGGGAQSSLSGPVPMRSPAGASHAGHAGDDDFELPQPPTGAGGTRVLERPKPTTFSSAASEIGRLPPAAPRGPRGMVMGLGAAAVLLVGGAVVFLGTRGGPSKTTAAGPADVVAPAVAVAAATAPATKAPVETSPPNSGQPAGPETAPAAVPETVRIDIQGVPARTALTVDGRPGTLPVVLPYGSQVHHIVLRPPNAPERKLDVDGSRDRLIELVFDDPAAAAAAAAAAATKSVAKGGRERTGDKDSGRRSRRGAAAEEKLAPGSSDREAITDL
ncbi:MAG: serine/threonine-protein kinase [Pseudomonadota bacterium]